jgi:thiamine biosynthesis lipoprotein
MTWQRRARPLLGTLVEIGAFDGGALEAGFAAIAAVQAALSVFDPRSDIARFNALPAGRALRVGADAVHVLAAARQLQDTSGGLFDASLGTAPRGWHCDGHDLHKLDPATRLDLGGIAKGHAVDRAIEALRAQGCQAGWVNAGGDLRVFGDLALPLVLRDETRGGVRAFGTLADGAFATSRYAADSRSRASATHAVRAHVSVAAPLALWADALTKVVAVSGEPAHPLLARHGARAWIH